MGGPVKSVLGAILLTLSLPPALAWAPETRVRMVDEAVRLMPASLRKALESHRERLLRGMLAYAEGDIGRTPYWKQTEPQGG